MQRLLPERSIPMKLGAALTLFGLCGGVAAFAVASGCSSDSNDSSSGSETGRIPPEETGALTSSTEERTFALNTIQLGETDRKGNKDQNAWKAYGYNLDALVTNVTDKNSPGLSKVCKLVPGGSATNHQDGAEGIDNSFGKNILQLIGTLAPTPSKDINDALTRGDFTVLLKIKGLNDDPQQTATGLSGTLLIGGKFGGDSGAQPTFTTADDWPYLADPQVPLTGAYINKGEFVNGKFANGAGGATVKLAVSIQGNTLSLTINKAIVTFKNDPAGKALNEGTIAGVVDTEQLVSGIRAIAGRIQKDFCTPGNAALEGILTSIRQASDMLSDGSQDPSKVCNGISIGLGFTAKQVGTPTTTAAVSGGTDPCAEGSDGDAGSQ
jgi:hypothetical protein